MRWKKTKHKQNFLSPFLIFDNFILIPKLEFAKIMKRFKSKNNKLIAKNWKINFHFFHTAKSLWLVWGAFGGVSKFGCTVLSENLRKILKSTSTAAWLGFFYFFLSYLIKTLHWDHSETPPTQKAHHHQNIYCTSFIHHDFKRVLLTDHHKTKNLQNSKQTKKDSIKTQRTLNGNYIKQYVYSLN